MQALSQAKPEVVIDQLTALIGVKNYKKFDDEFALTNRLRTEGIDYLLEAAQAAGARRFIAQSYGNWNYVRTSTGLATEEDPLDPTPPRNQQQSLQAIRSLEHAVDSAHGIEGVALRYGNLYGPGTGFAVDGEIVATVRIWLPELAQAVGAKPPRHIPVWLGRLIIGEVGVSMMTQICGTMNAKARRELDWTPSYSTWRQGFRTGLG